MNRSRKLVAVLALALLPIVAAACSSGPNLPEGGQAYTESAQPGDVGATVTLKYSSFEPSIVTIKAGQTVEWMWEDNPEPHDVYIDGYSPFAATTGTVAPLPGPTSNTQPLSVQSPIMVTGTWYYQFTNPGTYYYICTVHDDMEGSVVVMPASGGV
jgi:plastocyanin